MSWLCRMMMVAAIMVAATTPCLLRATGAGVINLEWWCSFSWLPLFIMLFRVYWSRKYWFRYQISSFRAFSRIACIHSHYSYRVKFMNITDITTLRLITDVCLNCNSFSVRRLKYESSHYSHVLTLQCPVNSATIAINHLIFYMLQIKMNSTAALWLDCPSLVDVLRFISF